MNRPWWNMCYAHGILAFYFCVKSFQNVTNLPWVIERTRNTDIQCLSLNFDHEPTLVKHTHCSSTHHCRHLRRVICKFHQEFKNIKRTRKRDGQADRRTDRPSDNGAKTVCLPFHWERIITYIIMQHIETV